MKKTNSPNCRLGNFEFPASAGRVNRNTMKVITSNCKHFLLTFRPRKQFFSVALHKLQRLLRSVRMANLSRLRLSPSSAYLPQGFREQTFVPVRRLKVIRILFRIPNVTTSEDNSFSHRKKLVYVYQPIADSYNNRSKRNEPRKLRKNFRNALTTGIYLLNCA